MRKSQVYAILDEHIGMNLNLFIIIKELNDNDLEMLNILNNNDALDREVRDRNIEMYVLKRYDQIQFE